MGIIINGICIGFLLAIFISLYLEGVFNALLPFWIIYGILAPLISATAMTIGMLAKKNHNEIEWWEDGNKKRSKGKALLGRH